MAQLSSVLFLFWVISGIYVLAYITFYFFKITAILKVLKEKYPEKLKEISKSTPSRRVFGRLMKYCISQYHILFNSKNLPAEVQTQVKSLRTTIIIGFVVGILYVIIYFSNYILVWILTYLFSPIGH